MIELLESIRATCSVPDPGHAVTLPAGAYGSPELFELEKTTMFEAGWQPLCRTDQVAEPGSYYSIDLLGRPLVVTRDRQGALHVLSRVCRHRWMQVAEGQGRASTLQCPYHLWTYGLDARLVGAPHMGDTPDFDKSAFCLPELRFEDWHGFLFVNLDGRAEPLADQLGDLEPYLSNYDLDGYRTVETTEWGEPAWDWKILVENFMECYHHIGPHARSLEDEFPGAAAWTDRGGETFSVMHIPQDRKYEPTAPFLAPGSPLLKGSQLREILIFTVFPHFMVSIGPGFLYWMKVLPLGPGRIGLQLDICMSGAALAAPDHEAMRETLVTGVVDIHKEDLDICAAVQRAASSGAVPGVGRLSLMEQPIWEFYRWLGRRLGLLGSAQAGGASLTTVAS